MSRGLSRFQAILLGLLVFLALGLAGFGLFAVGSRTWFPGDTFSVQTGFRSIQGVEVGTRVRIQGIDAGEVVSVSPPTTPGGDVVLRLRINGSLRHLIRADASVQIVSEGLIGGKVLEIAPGSATAPPVSDDGVLASRPSTELTDVLDEVKTTLQGVRDGEGPLGREMVSTLQQAKNTLRMVENRTDALGNLPILRNYTRDAQKILFRPNCERVRTVFAEADLFEPGRAALTAQGKQRLDEAVPRLKGSLKHDGADLVVVACADGRSLSASEGQLLTNAQSEAVSTYLKGQHSVQKAGWVTWRSVTPLGLGTEAYPGEEKGSSLPPARLELLVFVPLK